MSSGEKKNDGKGSTSGAGEDDGGGGWVSTLFKVAGAAAATVAVASSMYSLMKQPRPMKLNVDGSRLRRFNGLVSTGCGGVLRDATGNWECGFAQKLDPSLKEDETEREGILRGLEWARGKGVKKVMVESDNKGVVDLVNSGSKSTDRRIGRIRELLNSRDHWEATLTWVKGDANKLADKLADIAHNFPDFDLHEFDSDSPPDNCKHALIALSKDMQALLMRN